MRYLLPLAERHDWFTGYTTIPGELLTSKERTKRFPHLPDSMFATVEISQNKTSVFCGVRKPLWGESPELVHLEFQN